MGYFDQFTPSSLPSVEPFYDPAGHSFSFDNSITFSSDVIKSQGVPSYVTDPVQNYSFTPAPATQTSMVDAFLNASEYFLDNQGYGLGQNYEFAMGINLTPFNYDYWGSGPDTLYNQNIFSTDVVTSGVSTPTGGFQLEDNVRINSKSFDEYTAVANTNEFYIKYLDPVDKKSYIFYFALPPAIESYAGGRGQVPELRPGILHRSSVNVKHFSIPGTVPAYQVMGLDPTILQISGLMIGAERVVSNVSEAQSISPQYELYKTRNTLGAHETAKVFSNRVGKSGAPVVITLKSTVPDGTLGADKPVNLTYTCILQNFRQMIRGSDRVYYSIDALVLSEGDKSSTAGSALGGGSGVSIPIPVTPFNAS